MEQAFIILLNAVVLNERIQSFIILKASLSVHELMSDLQTYDEAWSRLHQLRQVEIASTAQDIQPSSQCSYKKWNYIRCQGSPILQSRICVHSWLSLPFKWRRMPVLIMTTRKGFSWSVQMFRASAKAHAAIVINQNTRLMTTARSKEMAEFTNFVGNKGIMKETAGQVLKKNRSTPKKSIKVR